MKKRIKTEKTDEKNWKIITCPKCGKSISIDDALTHQIEEKIKKEFDEKNRLQEAGIVKQKKESNKWDNYLIDKRDLANQIIAQMKRI